MRKRQCLFIIILTISIMNLFLLATAQMKISKDKIPATIPADVKKQIEKLYSEDFLARKNAALKLGEMKAEAAIPFLIALLPDNTVDADNVTVGEQSAQALGQIGKPAVEPLIEALKNQDDSAKSNAAAALGLTEDLRAVEPLLALFKNSPTLIRFSALGPMSKIKDPRVVDFLIATANDKTLHWYNRSEALRTLSTMKESKAFDALLDALKNEEPGIRSSTARAMGDTNNLMAVEPLINALKDAAADVRAYAVVSLGKLKDLRAVQPLITTFNDPWTEIPPVTVNALAKIGSPAIDPLILSLKNGNVTERIFSAQALGKIKDTRAIKPLINAFKDPDVKVQSSAENALATMGDISLEPLIEALKDTDVAIRAHSASVLTQLKNPKSVDALISALKDTDASVRAQAAVALTELKDTKAVMPLIECLKDKDTNVQARAASALGVLKDERAIEPLINALKVDNWDVQYNAAQTLRAITGQDFGQDAEKWTQWYKSKK